MHTLRRQIRCLGTSDLRSTALVLLVVQLLVGVEVGSAQIPEDLVLVPEISSGLFSPVAVRHAGDGSGRLFIVDLGDGFAKPDPIGGRVMVWDGASLGTFLDLSTMIFPDGEMGLLGLAFHPDYETNGFFYLNYTGPFGGGGATVTRIERCTVSVGDPNVADPMSATTILEIAQPYDHHNGGDLHFGPDGYLYVAMGDGGDMSTPQDPEQLLGKMLRLDVDAPPRGGSSGLCGLVQNYAVPSDNPNVGVAGCDEIWSSGFRNPFRWSFDRGTGDLFVADVGEDTFEEINWQPASSVGGENYGWPCREGTIAGPGAGNCPARGGFTDPVLEYAHPPDPTCATVIGGYVYRGAISGLQGRYVYADWCVGEISTAEQTSPGVFGASLWDTGPGFAMLGFGEDEVGELYVTLWSSVQRVSSPSSDAEIFRDGFESGDLSEWGL